MTFELMVEISQFFDFFRDFLNTLLERSKDFCWPNAMKISMRLAHIVIEMIKIRFDDLLSFCIKSAGSKVQKNAFTSNGQNHPKGSPKGKLGRVLRTM